MSAVATEPPSAARPDVRLPALDTCEAAKTAAGWAATNLPTSGTAEERALAAAALTDKLTRRLDRIRTQRDAAAFTVATTMRVRRGGGIATALGVGRTRWKVIRDHLADNPPQLVEGADEKLPRLARETVLLAAQLELAINARDQAVKELVAAGWTNSRTGRLIGRHPARVSHVRNRPAETPAT